jgi:hypothetical protein
MIHVNPRAPLGTERFPTPADARRAHRPRADARAAFLLMETQIETYGESIGAILDGFHLFPSIAFKYLVKHGMARPSASGGRSVIDREAWYPTVSWLAVYDEIAQDVGTGPLFDIGVQIPENAPFPPHIVDVESAIASLDVAYHMNHRKNGAVMYLPTTRAMLEGIGHYGCQRVPGEQTIRSVCDNPYPCDFDRGILTGAARRFAPKAKVVHERGSCRKDGDDRCTYVVTW